jgi:hypothetical protein
MSTMRFQRRVCAALLARKSGFVARLKNYLLKRGRADLLFHSQ